MAMGKCKFHNKRNLQCKIVNFPLQVLSKSNAYAILKGSVLHFIEGDYMTDVKLYKDNIIQGTNHRSSRISRGKVLSKIIASATV